MKNLKVEFEQPEAEISRTVNSTFFHYGILVNEETKEETEFSLCEMYDANSDSSSFELTFPNDDKEVTKEIEDFIASETSKL
jgi:hypothetical protein